MPVLHDRAVFYQHHMNHLLTQNNEQRGQVCKVWNGCTEGKLSNICPRQATLIHTGFKMPCSISCTPRNLNRQGSWLWLIVDHARLPLEMPCMIHHKILSIHWRIIKSTERRNCIFPRKYLELPHYKINSRHEPAIFLSGSYRTSLFRSAVLCGERLFPKQSYTLNWNKIRQPERA